MVIAGHGQHAALGKGPREIGVLEGVAGAVHARRLAVPHAVDAVELRAREKVRLLAAPDGGGGEVFVKAFLEHHLGGLEIFRGAAGLLVQPAKR